MREVAVHREGGGGEDPRALRFVHLRPEETAHFERRHVEHRGLWIRLDPADDVGHGGLAVRILLRPRVGFAPFADQRSELVAAREADA